MFQTPEHIETLSYRLVKVLDDIGINERIILRCHRSALLTDIHHLHGKGFRSNVLCSNSEGTLPDLSSDREVILTDNRINFVQTTSKWKSEMYMASILRVNVTPKTFQENTCGRVTSRYSDPQYTISEWLQVQSTRRTRSKNAKQDKQNDTELTVPVHYNDLPFVDNNRKEFSNCTHSVVPYGHILSENESVKWRIAFSCTDQKIIFSLNITHLRCYILLKLLLETYTGPFIGGEEANFMCKTVLIHAIERTGYTLWTENNLFLYLSLCLSLLHMFALDNYFPNYFIPAQKLLDGRIDEKSRMKLVHQIILLHQDTGAAVLGIRVSSLGRRFYSCVSQLRQYAMAEVTTDDDKMRMKMADIEQLWSAGKEKQYLKECERICTFIKNKSDKIVYVWPAYDTSEKKTLVFVVVANGNVKVDVEYRLYIRIVGHYREEGKRVMHSRTNAENRLSASQSEKICNVIDRYADTLMQNHSYISVITGSGVRSVGFTTENEEIIPEACVVIYVLIKGKIPINEEEIPKSLGGVPVDIREGGFQTCVLTASDFHTNVQMGCQIMSTANQHGTLGGFVDHQEYGLCGITCAHVVMNEQEIHNHRGVENVPFESYVYQPDNKRQKHMVGPVRDVTYKAGGNGVPGIDLAIFQIDCRPPESGNFPGTSNSETDLVYESGKVGGEKQFNTYNQQVVKFGSRSGVTEGFVEFCDTCVRKINFDREYIVGPNRYTYTLFSQLEIRPSGFGISFNEGGDSGALVFKKDVTGNLICIGMVVGAYSNGNGIVTPISAIKRQLGVSELKNFTSNKIDRLERRMQRMEQYLEKIASKIGVN